MKNVRRRSHHARQVNKRSRRMRSQLRGESLERRLLLASDWQNGLAPLDVNHDTVISSGDALSVVNDLNLNGVRSLGARAEAEGGGPTAPSIDVNGDGNASPSDVLAVINFLNGEGEDGAFIQYRIAVFDAAGDQEISSIGLGEEAVVKVFVSDIRMSGRAGVFSGYLDIDYDASVVEIVPNAFTQLDLVTFEEVPVTIMDNQQQYGQGRSGDTSTPGVIDGAGSFSSSLAPLGPTERELLKFKVRAIAEGSVTFTGSPTTEATGDPGQSPTLDTGLYNTDNPVCPSEARDPATNDLLCRGTMMFVNPTVSVVSDIVALPDSLTVNEDSGASDPLDVLDNDTANVGTINLASFTDPSNGQVVRNGDDTFTYTPNDDFFGSDSFTYTINNGQGAESTATVSITVDPVNDPPVLTVPGGQTIDEDNALTLSGLSVVDVDADAGSGLEVRLSVNDGFFTFGSSSATVTGDGTSQATISGAVADVNTALGDLTYTPSLNFYGDDTLSITASDLGNFGDGGEMTDSETVSITINPINDPPVNIVPGPQTVFNTETLTFSGGNALQVSDVDAGMLEVNLTVTEGTLTLSSTTNLQVTGDGSTSLTATGAQDDLNSALDGLVFDPIDGFIGSDSLAITTSDLGGSGAGGVLMAMDTISLTITPPEVPFAASDLYIIEEDSGASVFNVLGNDLAPDGQNTLSITQLNGLPVATSPTQTTSTGGTLSFANGEVSYTPAADFFGTDSFSYTIESAPDVGDGPSTGIVEIEIQPINDPPVLTLPGGIAVDEDDVVLFSGSDVISVSDIDAGVDGVTLMLMVDNGTLTVGGETGPSVTLDGTVTSVNDQLNGLTYTPDLNYAGQDSLSIVLSDKGNTGGVSGDPLAETILTDTDTVNITIQPINDAPVLTVPGAQSFISDFDNVFSADSGNAISISDVDAGDNDVHVDLTIGDGTLTLSSTSSVTVTGNGTNDVSLTGTVDNLNAALASGVTYRTTASGDKTLTAVVNDLGSTGGIAGDPNAVNPLSVSDTVSVEVLDFVPSNIGGYVFVDDNGNGEHDMSPVVERGLEGVDVTLYGTDAITGQEITPITVTTSNDGYYLFENLRPGTYTFGTGSLPHFLAATPHFESPVTLTSGNMGAVAIDIRGAVDSRGNDFPVMGLNGTFFDGVHHQTPLNPPNGELYNNLLFAIDATDPSNPSTVVTYQGNWDGYGDARVVLSSDGQSATVTVKDQDTGQEMSRTLSFLSGRFRVRSIGGLTTVRVFMTPDMLAASPGTDAFAAAVDEVMAAAR